MSNLLGSASLTQFKINPVASRTIKLPKIGEVAINLHRPIPEGFIVKQVRVLSKARCTQWYVVITIEADVSVPKFSAHGRAIGIDLGLERFLTVDDGSSVERPKFLKSLKGKLRLLQMRGARCQKRSNNWEKAQVTVAKLHHHIANTRKDFHLKTAHSLCLVAQTIFAENLNTVGLNRGMLCKDCIDASFGQFLSLLEWVCWKRGAYFLKVNPSGTSQTCPECLATVSKPLSEREHVCPECGYTTHRDCAAARMVLLRGDALSLSKGNELVPVDNGEPKRKTPIAGSPCGGGFSKKEPAGSRSAGGENLGKRRRSRNAAS